MIKINNKELYDCFIGDSPVKLIYAGSDLVWAQKCRITLDLTGLGEFTNYGYSYSYIDDPENIITEKISRSLGDTCEVVFEKPLYSLKWGAGTSVKVKNIKYLHTENIVDFYRFFNIFTDFSKENLSDIRTDSAESFANAFFCRSDIQEIDLSFITSQKLKDLTQMFYGCEALTKVDFGHLEAENVTTMDGMFSRCSSIENIILPKNLKNVMSIKTLFSECSQLKTIDISGIINPEIITTYTYMFSNCVNLARIRCTKKFQEWLMGLPQSYLPLLFREGGSGVWDICD